MANTKISDLGTREISVQGNDKRVSALGDGTAKPGDLVGITDATGKVVQTDIGASEMFRGILDNDYKTAEDTAIPDGSPCSIIIPESGKKYNMKCKDPGGAVVSGLAHKLSDTAGAIEGAANTNIVTAGSKALNTRALANGDTVGEFQWL